VADASRAKRRAALCKHVAAITIIYYTHLDHNRRLFPSFPPFAVRPSLPPPTALPPPPAARPGGYQLPRRRYLSLRARRCCGRIKSMPARIARAPERSREESRVARSRQRTILSIPVLFALPAPCVSARENSIARKFETHRATCRSSRSFLIAASHRLGNSIKIKTLER